MRNLILVCTIWLSACAGTAPVQTFNPQQQAAALLITVAQDRREAFNGSPSRIFAYAGPYEGYSGAKRVLQDLSRQYQLAAMDAWPIKSLGVYCQVFAVANANAEALIAKLKIDPRVESVQWLQTFNTLANTTDPYRKLQNSLDQLGVSAAHQYATGRDIRIAIVDTHIDVSHPDLAGRVTVQKNVLPAKYDQADIHGTAVAGIVAATVDNGEGIVGVAPHSKLIALTACWADADGRGTCNSFTLARALDLALTHHADIINLSLSGPSDALLERMIQHALARQVVVVGAYDPNPAMGFPGHIEGVINVAESATDQRAFVAPGQEVLTTVPDGYDFISGNSIAAAHVSGVVALALEAKPKIHLNALRTTLRNASESNGSINACVALSLLNATWSCTGQNVATIPTLN